MSIYCAVHWGSGRGAIYLMSRELKNVLTIIIKMARKTFGFDTTLLIES